ncbi:NapC/NirT cytochrome c family protein [Campylobacter iguaniorum]|nr:NapC/NirT family cytochrome c [Campylobacter iguaniorum]ANE36050.1 NapC/NirT cytochrome c family protein [Campylobacter iguaniorum]
MELRKTKLFTFIILVIGGIVGLVFALGIAQFFYVTGGEKFCTMCHVMEPMGNAYKDDVHGGNNKVGFKAECVSCHLPHDNIAHYVYQKSVNGIVEGALTFFGNPEKYDWQARRKEAKRYVYDDGCLHCHTDLKKISSDNMKSFLAHRDYFAKNINKTCVECHEHVGHKNLGFHLKAKFGDLNITK